MSSMNKHFRKVAVIVSTILLLGALVASMTGTSSAANLTGGNYTYVINGEEATFPFDPVVRQGGGVLLPIEVYQQFGITVEGALTRTIVLRKGGDVTATLTLGTTTASVDGNPVTLATAPLRLSGRLFIPGDLLREFGVEFSQDGNYVVMRNLTEGQPIVKKFSDSEFQSLKTGRKFVESVKADSNIYLDGEFTLLTPDLLSAENLNFSYGTRARLQALLQTNTLVMMKLSNASFKSGAFVTANLFAVDDKRNQYDVQSVVDTGDGLINSKLVPAGDKIGVLVFPKLANNAVNLTVYYDNNGGSLGAFYNLK